MTRAAMTTAVLAALAFACLPLRADDAFTRELEEAVYQLVEHGQGLAKGNPSSVMAQNLANLFSEIGSRLLLRNEHMETQKTPNEERIPILRRLYLQQMRRIHEMEPDGNSRAEYNERSQSLGFYYYSSTGGGGGGGGGIGRSLEKTLLVKESWERERIKSVIYPLIGLMLFALAVLAFFLVGSSRRNRRQSA